MLALRADCYALSGDALEQRTEYEYDELGNRLVQRDANGHETRFEYDALGRETARLLPDGSRESKTYDAAGNLATRTDFLGRTTTYSYDLTNRLTSRLYPNAAENVSFTYTATGRRLTATDARGTTSYGYDLRDRLTSLLQPGVGSLGYGHDGNGNRTSLTATIAGQSHATGYGYDDAGRLDVVTDPAGRTYDFEHDPNGNRASLAYPNGTATTYTYDALNRLTNLATTGPLGAVQGYAFTLGPAGNRMRIDEADGTIREYGYDALYRLTSETVRDGVATLYSKSFTYDPVGNRQQQVTASAGRAGLPAPGTVDYAYDTRDRLLAENANASTYDPNGNLTAKVGEATYTWDHENRLIGVAKADGTSVAYQYDADGNRVSTTTTPAGGSATTTGYLVDTSGGLSHVVADVDATTPATPTLSAVYVRGSDDLLSVLRTLVPAPASPADWQTRYYHADGIGSIRRLTDENGAITDGYTYTAFGERLSHTGTDPQVYAFAGEPIDPNSGFQYHRARWMDPRSARFVGMDPFGGKQFDPPSLHKYIYAGGNPADRVDPSGLDWNLPSLSMVGTNLSILVATSFPRLFTVFLTVANILSPVDLGIPAPRINLWQMRGAVARGGVAVLEELGSIRRAWVALGGKATGPIGLKFEEWIAKFLSKTARTQVRVLDGVELGVGRGSGSGAGGAKLDHVDDALGQVVEVKSSFSTVSYNQALQAGQYTAQSGKELIYVFLKRPTNKELNELMGWLADGVAAANKTEINARFTTVF